MIRYFIIYTITSLILSGIWRIFVHVVIGQGPEHGHIPVSIQSGSSDGQNFIKGLLNEIQELPK